MDFGFLNQEDQPKYFQIESREKSKTFKIGGRERVESGDSGEDQGDVPLSMDLTAALTSLVKNPIQFQKPSQSVRFL